MADRLPNLALRERPRLSRLTAPARRPALRPGDLLTTLYPDKNKVVAAVCHGVGALLPAREADGSWTFAGQRLTGFTDEEETRFGFGDKARWLLESRLRENGAAFESGAAFGPEVVVDGNLITGQNPASAQPAAKAVMTYPGEHAAA